MVPNISKIIELRKKNGLSQHQLSKAAALNGNAIYRIETGITKKTHHLRAREIASVLGCQVSEIFEEAE